MLINPPYLVDEKSFHTMKELAAWAGIKYATVLARLRKGWTIERAVKTQVKRHNRRPKQMYKIGDSAYPTIASLAKAYDIPYATLAYRIKKDWSLEDAVQIPVKEIKRESVQAFGVTYPSLSNAAEVHGKCPEYVRQRVRSQGMTMEDALTLPNQLSKPVTVNGVEYPTMRAAADEYGIKRETFYSRIFNGYGLEDAVAERLDNKTASRIPVTIHDRAYSSLSNAARMYGLSPGTLHARLKIGFTPEKAVSKKVKKKPDNVPMTVDGRTYPSIKHAAEAYNLPKPLVYKRKARGWSDEDAIKIPSGAGYQFEYGGRIYRTFRDACAVTGIAPATAIARLKSGWSLDAAFDPLAEVSNRKSIMIRGATHSTYSEAARTFGVSEKIFMGRLQSGWTPEQAVGVNPPPDYHRGHPVISRKEYIERLGAVHGYTLDFSQAEFGKALEKVKVMCAIDCRHAPFYATPNNLLRGRSCPICKSSSGERAIALWLKNAEISFEREWTGHGLSSTSDRRGRFRFDFYLPERRMLIEFDGEQHFKPTTFGRMSEGEARKQFEKTKRNDWAKNEWAAKNGFDLLRIRFDEDIDDILLLKIN